MKRLNTDALTEVIGTIVGIVLVFVWPLAVVIALGVNLTELLRHHHPYWFSLLIGILVPAVLYGLYLNAKNKECGCIVLMTVLLLLAMALGIISARATVR